jgi:flagellar basal-body rod protein FlgC
MDLLNPSLEISSSGLRAQRLRLDAIASNLANATTTRTDEGGPYKRRNVIFVPDTIDSDFGSTLAALSDEGARQGVKVADVVEDTRPPRMVFEPGHPDANPEGYVAYPNVNAVTEMVDLMTATRAYEANVQAINASKRMSEAALGIGG